MTTIYKKLGAVHGFSVEFYRVHRGEVEFCDIHGRWVPSKWSRLDVREALEAGSLTVVPWAYYHADFEGWHVRVADAFVQVLAGGSWGPSMILADEVPNLVRNGVLKAVKPEDIPV